MKKAIAIILSFMLAMAVTFPAAALTSIPVKGIRLNSSNVNLKIGGTFDLKTTFTPANTSQKLLSYATSNKKIATVDKNGKIRAVSIGNTTITVLSSNKSVSTKCYVTVTKDGKPKNVTLKVLVDWNGSSSLSAKDPINNPVAKALKEKTGVTFDVEYATTSESEKLNLIFASGDMPDIINGPMWGGTDPCTQLFKKAAAQGLLYPLDDLVNKYSPLLKEAMNGMTDAAYKGIATDFKEIELNDPSFKGKHYFIPWQTARTTEDITNWGYNVFARKDILDALKVKPSDVNTSEKLYDLMKKIKAGNFKDSNGNPVIPSGGWGNGWAYNMFYASYDVTTFTDYIFQNGKYINKVFSPNLDKQILYMRKLVSEGLIDPECFRQNDSAAKEKAAVGKIAIYGNHYDQITAFIKPTLYQTNPEMKYIPIGPIPNAKGEIYGGIELDGRSGSPTLCITSSCKNPDAAVKFLDYINSDEGLKLICYGIQGKHYTLVNGKPKLTKEWQDKWNKNPQDLKDQGIQSVYTYFITLDNRVSNWGEKAPGEAQTVDKDKLAAQKNTPTKFFSGYRITNFHDQYPQKEKLDSLVSGDLTGSNKDMREKAYFAKSDADALKILEDYRQQLIKGGIQDYEKYLTQKGKTRKDMIN